MARVLIVDDEAAVRSVLRRHLVNEFRAEVSEAPDGIAALDYLLHNKCDLVLLDLRMPGLDGVKTLQALRRSPVHIDLPVVLVSGCHDPVRLREALTLGVVSFVTKPISLQLLRERLADVLAVADLPVAEAVAPAPTSPPAVGADPYAERCLAAASVAVRRELEHITGQRVTTVTDRPEAVDAASWTIVTAEFEARRTRWTLALLVPDDSARTVASLGAAALRPAAGGGETEALRWLSMAAIDGVRDAVDVTAADTEPVCLADLATYEQDRAERQGAGERWLAIPTAGVTMRVHLSRQAA